MIAILIVSHSQQLAAGAQELAQQMAPAVPILAAGGTDEGEIGTSFERIATQLAEAAQADGVLVLMDLGSAVMTTEMALEMLAPEEQARIRLSNAPLVEGAIAAATVAAGGASLADVAAAANEARTMQKVAGVEDQGDAAADHDVIAEDAAELVREAEVVNPAGLHARPAAQIAQAVAGYEAEVWISTTHAPQVQARAQSIVKLLTLAARQGDTLRLAARGPQGAAALERVIALVEAGFGEMEAAPAAPTTAEAQQPLPTSRTDQISAIAAAPGSAIGAAFLLAAAMPVIPDDEAKDIAAEHARLDVALRGVAQELAALEAQPTLGAAAGIFGAQRMLLNDPTLREAAQRHIDGGTNAAAAWHTATQEQATLLRAANNPLIAERATDLDDVGRRVVRALTGAAGSIAIPAGSIVLAEELTPSETTALQAAGVAGIVTSGGGPTSHAAILARALGIPALVGAGSGIHQIEEGRMLVLDGDAGILYLDPDATTISGYQQKAVAAQQAAEHARAAAQEPATTRDGTHITVLANVASVAEAEAAAQNGAEGVGLLRTEFLFLHRPTLPSEEEQVAALRAIFAPLGRLPITVRTLDIGGDKALPALPLDPVTNGFLGVRGLRYSLENPTLFRTQLRAILRAAVGHRVRIMFPMVSVVEEVRAARAHLHAATQALDDAGIERGQIEQVGVMVEVPASALAADRLAGEVDFFSVGSNDLVQYTMAAERTNQAVASLYQPDHPALLRLLAQLVEQAQAQGCTVSLCGEMGGDPTMAPLLVGLGINALSMTPVAIPNIKTTIRQLAQQEEQARVQNLLAPAP